METALNFTSETMNLNPKPKPKLFKLPWAAAPPGADPSRTCEEGGGRDVWGILAVEGGVEG